MNDDTAVKPYMFVPEDSGRTVEETRSVGMSEGMRVFLIAVVAAGTAYLVSSLQPEWELWAFAISSVVAVAPFAAKAARKAARGVPFSIETLVSIAVIGALPIGAGAEAAVVVVLFSLGELLEGFAAERARSGLTALGRLLPTTAVIEVDGNRQTVDVSSLPLGAMMLVSAGDRVAADGKIVGGQSSLNEAAITGESQPVEKTVGDMVFAGAINGDGSLRVEVTSEASESVVARIGRLVEEAQETTAPTARFIDRFSAYYTPAALAIAILVAVVPPLFFDEPWSEWIYRALMVLLVACPCALVLSTPAAIATGIATAARQGILIKTGAALEQLAKIGIVAFDKTGTLTLGRPVVTDVEGDRAEVLRLAGAVEAGLSHPVAKAIVAEATATGESIPPAENVAIRQGEGAEGTVEGRHITLLSPRAAGALPSEVSGSIEAFESQGKTIAVVSSDGTYRGHIAVRDEARSDARGAIAMLTSLGLRSLMLSGDNQRTASAVASGLGLDAEGHLMPADKLERIRELETEAPVLMVGDGVNDAPALAAASLGLAMGGGTDVAIETADVGLLRDRLSGVPDAIRLARKTRTTIIINIAIAVGLKLIFLLLAVFGITNLWTAIIADTGATVLVTINALLLFWTFRPTRSLRMV